MAEDKRGNVANSSVRLCNLLYHPEGTEAGSHRIYRDGRLALPLTIVDILGKRFQSTGSILLLLFIFYFFSSFYCTCTDASRIWNRWCWLDGPLWFYRFVTVPPPPFPSDHCSSKARASSKITSRASIITQWPDISWLRRRAPGFERHTLGLL